MSADFVACMEDVLDLYAEPYDPDRPVVCFDETSKQLLAEKRSPIPAKPGRRERYDYEYQRQGTRNLFMLCEPRAGWRHVAVTERRTMVDFAQQMRWLADEAYPSAEKIRVVLDNLNTHKPASLYETFEPKEARRIRKRLEFHYTPKHGSWLNPVLSLSKGWQRSSSASWPGESCAGASPMRRPSVARSRPWRQNETKPERPLTGDSPLRTLASKCTISILPIIRLTEY